MAASTVTRVLTIGAAGACVAVLAVAGASTAALPGRNGTIVFSSNTGENINPQLFSVRPDGTGRKDLTHNNHLNVIGVWSPDGSKIAFAEAEMPGSVVAVMNADGSRQHRLTDTRQWASDPSWSPDGSLIAYVQNYSPNGIHVVRPDGSGDRLIAPGVLGSPAWSPDGNQIVLATQMMDGTGALIVVDVATGSTHKLLGGGPFSNPAWSPDGSSIAYAAIVGTRWEIHRIQPDGTDDRFVAIGWRAVWSPDARRLAVVGDVNEPGSLTVMDVDGTHPVLLSDRACDYPSWSPDSRNVAFVQLFTDVYASRADGTNRRRVTHEPAESRVDRAAWSPDGKRILYQAAHENNDAELYALVGGRVRAITHNNVNDTDPAWSPDGTAIAFSRSDPVAGARIVVASVSGRPARALTSGRGFDYSPSWSPDGSRIVFGSAFDDFEESLIYVMRSDGSGVRKLGAGFDPAWSPNGRLIAFAKEGDIWVMRSDGSHRRVLVTSDKAASALGISADQVEWLSSPAWSPDGKSVGFAAYYDLFAHGGDFFGAFTVRADGRRPTAWLDELTGVPTVEWSPDGRDLVFGAGDVYTASVKGGRPMQRTRLSGWSDHATWQPRCTVYGSPRGDVLTASPRDDIVCGLGGNDTITGGAGRDRLFGEGGDDRIDARDGEFDVIGCGPGSDSVIEDARDLVGRDCEHVVH